MGNSEQPQIVRSQQGNKSQPSTLFCCDDQTLLYGDDAREHRLIYPAQAAEGFKMLLTDPSKRYFGGTRTASDVYASWLSHMASLAKKQCGEDIESVTVTCPVTFNDKHKNEIVKSCVAAGLPADVIVIEEPTAASMGYAESERWGQQKPETAIVVDVGHGTTDVTVLRIEAGLAKAIATEGDAKLGGRDYTEVVRGLLLEKVSKLTGRPITVSKLPPEVVPELDEKAEKGKHALSGAQPSTKIALNFGGKSQLVELIKDEIKTANAPLDNRVKDCTDRAVKASKLDLDSIDHLVLVGGQCNSLLIQEMLANHTGKVPQVKHDPVMAVAIGAALIAHQAARRKKGHGRLPGTPVLLRTVSHDIGVAVIEIVNGKRTNVCSAVVKKGTVIGDDDFVADFRLERPNQTEALIEILQGPDNAPADQCLTIGKLEYAGLKPEHTCSDRIRISFHFDASGIVTVTATDKIGGITKKVGVKLK